MDSFNNGIDINSYSLYPFNYSNDRLIFNIFQIKLKILTTFNFSIYNINDSNNNNYYVIS